MGAAEPLAVGVGDAETRLGDVARDRAQPAAPGVEALAHGLEPRHRPGTDEQGDIALTAEQEREQLPADEARGTGDEVLHGRSSSFPSLAPPGGYGAHHSGRAPTARTVGRRATTAPAYS